MFLRMLRWNVGLVALLVLVGCTTGAGEPAAPVGAVNGPITATPVATEPVATEPVATTGAIAVATTPVATTPVATTPDAFSATPEATQAASDSGGSRVKAPPAPAELDRLKLNLQPVAQGLAQPLFLTHAGAPAVQFIVEKPGRIRILEAGKMVEQPFLDITDRVRSSGSEQGLLGLAFSPDYAQTGFFFINYTDSAGDTVVARYTAAGEPQRGDPASEFVVLRLDQPAANHNGGMLAFGPDGMLWVGTGDGGAANDQFNNGQNPRTLLGKMLRLDVTSNPATPYTIPADNPFVNANWNGQEVADEVWALGLRNPWRYSFDRVTGDLWIADVGQNKLEEVNLTRGGGPGGEAAAPQGGLNYGWPLMEGLACFRDAQCTRDGLELPIVQYEHGADGCSITGGYVYRGNAFPALQGVYFYADFCSGRLWGLTPDGANGWYTRLMLETGMSVSSFGEDARGELYLTDLQRGIVQQLTLAQ